MKTLDIYVFPLEAQVHISLHTSISINAHTHMSINMNMYHTTHTSSSYLSSPQPESMSIFFFL